MQKIPYLLTGATGFVGRHILQLLHEDPSIQAIALVRSKASWKKQDWTSKLKGVELIEGSVTEPEAWIGDPRLKGLAGIYHLAAMIQHTRKAPEEMFHTNVQGLLEMIRVARRFHCRVLFVSTSGTVGCFSDSQAKADEKAEFQEATVGSWPYYASKIEAERQGRTLAERLGVELVILRPPVLLGPGDHRGRATAHIARLLRGKLPFVVKGGIHFVDIRDVSRAMVRAMKIARPKPVYHFCGSCYPIDRFFRTVAAIGGVPPPKLALPGPVAALLAKVSGILDKVLPPQKHPILPDPVVFEMASKHWGLASLYAEKDLGFVSRDSIETLSDTVEWLKRHDPELPKEYAGGLEPAADIQP